MNNYHDHDDLYKKKEDTDLGCSFMLFYPSICFLQLVIMLAILMHISNIFGLGWPISQWLDWLLTCGYTNCIR